MSEEQLKDFLKAIKADSSFLEKLKEAESLDDVAMIAEAAGLETSADELQKHYSGHQRELSEEVLENAIGGANNKISGDYGWELGCSQ